MDEAEMDRARDDLLSWGLLEREETGLAWSRRFRGAVLREASRLAEAERGGERAQGAPLLVAVSAALLALAVPARDEHARLLYAVELAALPEAVRAMVA